MRLPALRKVRTSTLLLSAAFLWVGSNPAQVSNPGGNPWERDLMVRSSSDGGSFGQERTFNQASGVPSLVRDQRGWLYAAFQWFPKDDVVNWDRVAVKISQDDGNTWSNPQPIQMAGLPQNFSRPFDPTLAVLDDGRIRIYFSSNTGGQQTLDDRVGSYSAVSADGIHYTFEAGRRFGVDGKIVIDPAVLRLGGTWHYIAPIGRPEEGAYHAVSNDGLNFIRVDDIPSVGGVNWTGNLVAHGGGMRFYGGSSRGIWWSFSADGRTWTDPTYTSVQGGDPTVVATGNGSYLMVYVGNPTSVPAIQVENTGSSYGILEQRRGRPYRSGWNSVHLR
jgi:hypothetical protein